MLTVPRKLPVRKPTNRLDYRLNRTFALAATDAGPQAFFKMRQSGEGEGLASSARNKISGNGLDMVSSTVSIR